MGYLHYCLVEAVSKPQRMRLSLSAKPPNPYLRIVVEGKAKLSRRVGSQMCSPPFVFAMLEFNLGVGQIAIGNLGGCTSPDWV